MKDVGLKLPLTMRTILFSCLCEADKGLETKGNGMETGDPQDLH